MHIRGLWEEKGSSDTRLLESLFIPDGFTVVGRSDACGEQARREHVIPRRVLVKECHRRLENGESDAALATFLRDHVKVVIISEEERQRLDRWKHLGLRQKMPSGWQFGDDIFARLNAAGISWQPVASTTAS